MTQEELFLCNAADALRSSIENGECSFLTSFAGINNAYFLNLYKYIENQSFLVLPDSETVSKNKLLETFIDQSFTLYKEISHGAINPPFIQANYQSKHSAFLYNLCIAMNTVLIEPKHTQDSVALFAKAIWQNYTKNWNAIPRL